MPSSSLTVLVVCTGNICRSPSAELLLGHGLEQRRQAGASAEGCAVTSAGLGCYDGWPIDPPVANLLEADGVPGWQEFRSQAVTDALVSSADLVLTATRAHRFRIGERWPEAYQRTFALGEASGLVESGDLARLPVSFPDRGHALVGWLAEERGVRQVPDAYDLADPHGRQPADYEQMMTRLKHMVAVLLDAFVPARSQSQVSSGIGVAIPLNRRV